ncbi:MAG TPA: PIG-L family deacetylase, partial [Bryobacteraceae bacterium]|nr:PIG-L family deacetylase [Bryobacteraceae bacterium]
MLFLTYLPAYSQRNLSGTPEIELALHKLNVLGSVLMIAAHPDDENTALLAYYARGRSMRTGYLSLTRGEGGQNLIGPEQGDLLGVIRTQELLAARRIDGAEQFFSRAIDFGFSKSADETLGKWGRETVLSDVVWVIRNFRPDVVILRFSGTPRDGHGQHQASAILGKEAFTAAADKDRFPEQLRYVQPWQARRLLFNVFSFSPEQEKEAREMPHR